MCGCTSGYKTSSKCAGGVSELQGIRNSLITLEKLVSGAIKQEYKDTRAQVEELLRDSYKICPDASLINGLKVYIENERTKYNN